MNKTWYTKIEARRFITKLRSPGARLDFYELVDPYLQKAGLFYVDASVLPAEYNYQELFHAGCRGVKTAGMTRWDNAYGASCRLDGSRLDYTEGDSPTQLWKPWRAK